MTQQGFCIILKKVINFVHVSKNTITHLSNFPASEGINVSY